MKILMASHYFASHKGGVEIVAEQLFRNLTAMQQEVVWIAADATPPPVGLNASQPVGLRTFNFVEGRIGVPVPIPSFRALKRIRGSVNEADVLILHDCLYFSNIAAYVFARLRGVPILVIQHTVPNERGLINVLMKVATAAITRPMLSGADQVVFISCATSNFYATQNFKVPPRVVYNGVDTEIFRPIRGSEMKSELRRKFGLSDDCRVILFVGRFVEKKGIAAIRDMAARRPKLTWAFAGWGPHDPNTWKLPNVRVFSGLRDKSLATLYGACDLLVLPSTGEGFPLVIQEALACGLPVVCGADTVEADPAMRSFVRGVPVYAGDPERTAREFLSAIDDALDGRDEWKHNSEERRAFAAARYSWPHAAQQYLGIASRLVPKQAGALEAEAGAGECSR